MKNLWNINTAKKYISNIQNEVAELDIDNIEDNNIKKKDKENDN